MCRLGVTQRRHEVGLLLMACLLRMAFLGTLAIFARAQELLDCSSVASPFAVGSTEDASTLATSLRCSTGDFDVQWVGEVFVAETIHVTNGTSLTITGAGSSAAVADGRNATQLFVVDQGASLHFSDMTFAHGSASFGGAINAVEASVSFSGNTSFISNSAGVDGGAIFSDRSTIFWDGDGTRFISNFAGDDGGAIYAQSTSNVSWNGDGTQFISNSASDNGGAIFAWESSVAWDGNGAQFIWNSAGDGGGAIYAYDSTVSWDGDGIEFSFNFANDDGGAIFAYSASNVYWSGDGTQFSSNFANDTGGAMFAYRSTLSWDGDDTEFSSNSARDDGGAILIYESNMSWSGDGAQFRNNSAGDDGGHIRESTYWVGGVGGAILAYNNSNLSWDGDDTHFTNNSAVVDGGAIYAWESNVSWYGDGNKFISNYAGFNGGSSLLYTYGGAIYMYGSTMFWDGDGAEFSSNSVAWEGGAIYAQESTVSWEGDRTLVTSNSAGLHGGAIYVTESSVSWGGDGTEFISNSAGANANAGAINAYRSNVSWEGNRTIFRSNSAGEMGGAIYVTESAVSWGGDDTDFSDNFAGDDGGAFFSKESIVSGNGDGTQFSNNVAGYDGGAIYADDSTVSWDGDGAQFSNNSAGYDGGAISAVESTVSWHSDGAQFSSNFAVRNGGAIRLDSSTVYWDGDGTQFSSNAANSTSVSSHGGAVSFSSSEVSWGGDGTNFSFNSADDAGGAIGLTFTDLVWNGNSAVFGNNSADRGGAIDVDSGSDLVWHGNGAEFSFNSAGMDGGAIYAHGTSESAVSLLGDNMQFSSNSAGDNGGAMFLTDRSNVFSDGNTTFKRNFARESGGAIASIEHTRLVTVYGGTFIENSAENGGALYFSLATGFNITQVTFTSNSAGSGGSGGAVAAHTAGSEDSPATLTRCNFSDNVSENGGAVETLAGELDIASCIFEGNSADEGGAMRLVGITVIRECFFLSNSASVRGFAVSVDGSTNISTSLFEGNGLHCASDSYRKDTEEEEPAARYETVCLGCPDWSECSDCSIASGNVVPTCEAPLEHTEAKQPGATLETLSIAKGYWRATNGTDNILACYNADACIGGQTGAEDYCAPGYKGPYCAACEPGYSPSLSYTCTRCSSSRRQGLVAATVIVALILACLVVAIVRYLVSTQPEEEMGAGCFRRRVLRAVPLQALKIIVVVWQILIQFADAAQVTYPGVYQDFLSAIGFVDFDLGAVLSAGCLWSNLDFHDRLLVNTLGPLVVVALLVITYLIAMYRSSSAGGDAVVEKIRYRHQTVLLLVTFLVYSSVSSTVFQTFACETLDDGAEHLRADYSIQCTDAKHKHFEVYAGIMICVYPVGIPLLYAILLFQRRALLAEADVDKTKAQSISSLWEPYRPERFYYEVVECGRRIMLTGVVVFIFPNDAAQLAITMLLAFFFFMVFEILRPYASESDMWLSRGGHMTVFLSMFYLLLQKVDVSSERGESQAAYGGLLVAAHVLMVLAIVVEMVGICYASRVDN